MNAIDGTDRSVGSTDGPPPSLLTIILDTNPHAWAYLSSTLPLQKAVANLIVFINAHLAVNHANQVAVLASHSQKTQWLYPTSHITSTNPHALTTLPNGSNTHSNGTTTTATPSDDANKYRPFRVIEQQILSNLAALLTNTPPAALASTTTTMIAGALTTALTYTAKQALLLSPTTNPGDPSAPAPGDSNDGSTATARTTLTARILVLSVSGDLASQYIPVMNAIFAAQRQRIPIDILKLAGDTVFLQQACDATGGIYMAPEQPDGLLQYLMMAFLPDVTARAWLVLPSGGEVDFRAACFCHRRVVDVGYVCSVCLSIFCAPLEEGNCLTCDTPLSLAASFTRPPALIPRKKKKKKRLPGEAGTPAGMSTPGGTPGPS